MSVLWAGNMRGPRLQTFVSKLLLLLLLLLSGRTRTVLCQEEDEQEPEENNTTTPEEEATDSSDNGSQSTPPTTESNKDGEDGGEIGSGRSSNVDTDLSVNTLEESSGTAETPPEDDGVGLLLIAIPVALVIIIIASIVCVIYIYRRCTSTNRHTEMRKEDPFLEGSSTEKVPMPMFEEDVPSVLELEMDELDDWMKKRW